MRCPEKISRRAFLSSSAAVALAGGCVRSAGSKVRARFGDMYEALDCHGHLASRGGRLHTWHPVIPDMDAYVRYLEECGVEMIIGTGGVDKRSGTAADVIEANDTALYWQERYPDMIRANCQANPNYLETSLAEMERLRRAGCAWVGELVGYSWGFEFNTPEYYRIVEKAIELNMVVQVHTGAKEFDAMAKKYPEATFVLCHFADATHGKEEQVERFEAVAANRNCYIDTAGSGIERIGMVELAVEKAGADRVLFGSDMPINDPSQALTRIAHSFLSEEDKRLILSGNLRRLMSERGVEI